MTVALLTNIVSPHQLPLAEAIVRRIGAENYRYAYTESFHEERVNMGWGAGRASKWCMPSDSCRDFLLNADLVYSELRDFDLFESRLARGLKTYYVSERWFKPILLPFGLMLPGWLKLLHPKYFCMARRLVKLFAYPGFRYLHQGPWAKKDMQFVCRCMGVDVPEAKYVPWGYFVEPSQLPHSQLLHSLTPNSSTLKVLWVGRMIGWKKVDTIVKAIRYLNESCSAHLTVTLVGNGDKKASLQKQVKGCTDIKFVDSVPIVEVRNLMQSHDIYVLASNGYEGWGAALNEALEEGMVALGTREAGASAAILPKSHQFCAGDWKALAKLLLSVARGELGPTGIGEWTAECAAEKLLAMV